MDNLHEERIEELAREKLEGKSYSEIRSELLASGIPEKEVSLLIRKVDERVLEETTTAGKSGRARQYYRFGLVLAIAGLSLSIAYNAGIVLGSFPALAVYIPFIAGIMAMFYGRMLQRRQPVNPEKGPGPIRKRRPYK